MSAIRHMAKDHLASFLQYSGMNRAYGFCNKQHNDPVIICYHRVVENFEKAAAHSIPSMLISTGMFESQIDWLARRYELVSLDTLQQDAGAVGRRRRKPLAAITFDDGYADYYWNAQPILRRKGIPSTIFVVTDLVGTRQLQTHDELYFLLTAVLENAGRSGRQGPPLDLAELVDDTRSRHALAAALRGLVTPYTMTRAVLGEFSHTEIRLFITRLRKSVPVTMDAMAELHSVNWNMLRELVGQGVTVGSHTQSHPLLAEECVDRVITELVESRRKLEDELDVRITNLAYPDGRYNESVAREAAAAGYEYAYTICNHQSRRYPKFTIPRKVLWERSSIDHLGKFSPAILSCQVNGIFDPSGRCPHDHLAPLPQSSRRHDTCVA